MKTILIITLLVAVTVAHGPSRNPNGLKAAKMNYEAAKMNDAAAKMNHEAAKMNYAAATMHYAGTAPNMNHGMSCQS